MATSLSRTEEELIRRMRSSEGPSDVPPSCKFADETINEKKNKKKRSLDDDDPILHYTTAAEVPGPDGRRFRSASESAASPDTSRRAGPKKDDFGKGKFTGTSFESDNGKGGRGLSCTKIAFSLYHKAFDAAVKALPIDGKRRSGDFSKTAPPPQERVDSFDDTATECSTDYHDFYLERVIVTRSEAEEEEATQVIPRKIIHQSSSSPPRSSHPQTQHHQRQQEHASQQRPPPLTQPSLSEYSSDYGDLANIHLDLTGCEPSLATHASCATLTQEGTLCEEEGILDEEREVTPTGEEAEKETVKNLFFQDQAGSPGREVDSRTPTGSPSSPVSPGSPDSMGPKSPKGKTNPPAIDKEKAIEELLKRRDPSRHYKKEEVRVPSPEPVDDEFLLIKKVLPDARELEYLEISKYTNLSEGEKDPFSITTEELLKLKIIPSVVWSPPGEEEEAAAVEEIGGGEPEVEETNMAIQPEDTETAPETGVTLEPDIFKFEDSLKKNKFYSKKKRDASPAVTTMNRIKESMKSTREKMVDGSLRRVDLMKEKMITMKETAKQKTKSKGTGAEADEHSSSPSMSRVPASVTRDSIDLPELVTKPKTTTPLGEKIKSSVSTQYGAGAGKLKTAMVSTSSRIKQATGRGMHKIESGMKSMSTKIKDAQHRVMHRKKAAGDTEDSKRSSSYSQVLGTVEENFATFLTELIIQEVLDDLKKEVEKISAAHQPPSESRAEEVAVTMNDLDDVREPILTHIRPPLATIKESSKSDTEIFPTAEAESTLPQNNEYVQEVEATEEQEQGHSPMERVPHPHPPSYPPPSMIPVDSEDETGYVGDNKKKIKRKKMPSGTAGTSRLQKMTSKAKDSMTNLKERVKDMWPVRRDASEGRNYYGEKHQEMMRDPRFIDSEAEFFSDSELCRHPPLPTAAEERREKVARYIQSIQPPVPPRKFRKGGQSVPTLPTSPSMVDSVSNLKGRPRRPAPPRPPLPGSISGQLASRKDSGAESENFRTVEILIDSNEESRMDRGGAYGMGLDTRLHPRLFYSQLRLNYKPPRDFKSEIFNDLRNPYKVPSTLNRTTNHQVGPYYSRPPLPPKAQQVAFTSDGMKPPHPVTGYIAIRPPARRGRGRRRHRRGHRPSGRNNSAERHIQIEGEVFVPVEVRNWEPFEWRARRSRSLTELYLRKPPGPRPRVTGVMKMLIPPRPPLPGSAPPLPPKPPQMSPSRIEGHYVNMKPLEPVYASVRKGRRPMGPYEEVSPIRNLSSSPTRPTRDEMEKRPLPPPPLPPRPHFSIIPTQDTIELTPQTTITSITELTSFSRVTPLSGDSQRSSSPPSRVPSSLSFGSSPSKVPPERPPPPRRDKSVSTEDFSLHHSPGRSPKFLEVGVQISMPEPDKIKSHESLQADEMMSKSKSSLPHRADFVSSATSATGTLYKTASGAMATPLAGNKENDMKMSAYNSDEDTIADIASISEYQSFATESTETRALVDKHLSKVESPLESPKASPSPPAKKSHLQENDDEEDENTEKLVQEARELQKELQDILQQRAGSSRSQSATPVLSNQEDEDDERKRKEAEYLQTNL